MPHERDRSFDIENSGTEIVIDTAGDHIVDVVMKDGDAAADYALDVSDRKSDWFTDTETFSGVTSIDDGYYNSHRYVRFRVTSGTGGSGDTADVLLSSAGKGR
jgi:hypothetical protein